MLNIRLKWRQGAMVFLQRAWSVRMLMLMGVIEGAKDYWFVFANYVRTDYFIYIGIGLTILVMLIEQPKMREKMKQAGDKDETIV